MAKKYTFKTPYSRDISSIRDVSLIEFKEPSQVKESLSYAVDINTIYNNYCKTGRLPLNGQQPIYDENFVSYNSLIEAYSTISEASSYFSSLPSEIRAHYGNSLEKFVKAVHSNDEYLCTSGVLKTIPSEAPPTASPSVDSTTPSTPSEKPVETPPATA